MSPDIREDPVGTLSLPGVRGHDLVIADLNWFETLATVAPRFPDTRFALFDGPLFCVRGRPGNVVAIELQVDEAAYLAGWLAARLERRRPDPDVVGAVGGVKIPPVDDFIAGSRAGAPAASRAEPDRARGRDGVQRRRRLRAGHAPGRAAGGVWGIGVDVDQSFLGPHILTSVIKGGPRGSVRRTRAS